ncbi:MAG: hypothetical protein H0V36_06615 [Chloroflexi bacterium]|nr:hypothetical protein [Chloroflexota bacterium]
MTDDRQPSIDANGEGRSAGRATSSAADQRELSRVATELLPALIARFGEGQLGELEIRRDGWRIRLRRGDAGVPAVSGEEAPSRRATSARPSAGRGEGPSATERGRISVTSMAVGYFQPAKTLQVGQRVRSGDVLGQVDMLGVRHDAVAGSDAIVSRVLAEAGQAVEYGQELVRLDRSGSSSERSAGSPDSARRAV